MPPTSDLRPQPSYLPVRRRGKTRPVPPVSILLPAELAIAEIMRLLYVESGFT
jgi:hypothetical protein